jgi:hypothetical protein
MILSPILLRVRYPSIPLGMATDTVTPRPEPESVTCPECGAVSYNFHDIAEGYCGNCHDWTSPRRPC